MRLPNGYGSVYRLPGNRRRPWIARKTTEVTEDGKQKYYTIGYFETRAKAMEALGEYNKNPIGELRDKTLGEIYNTWSKFKFGTISRSMVNGYKAAWKYLSVLEKQPICVIRKSHMQEIIKEMIASGLSRSSMEKVKTLAVILFNEAMDDNIVEKNFGSLIELPASRKAQKPTFSDMEIRKLERQAEGGDIWAGTIMILIYTGMRVGELLKLTKFNVDLQGWTITGGIKTDAGTDRVIPIHSKIRPYISFWHSQPGTRLISRDGKPISVDYYRASIFKPTLQRAGIERKLTPHSTRHTFATLLSKAKAPTKDIQAIMGHSDYAVTANTYTHPDVEELRSAIEMI